MNYKHPYILIALTLLTLLTSCKNGDKMSQQTIPLPSIKDVPQSAWDKLAQKKIYFGHQSVGYNIIDGIKDVMNENPQIKLNIVETSDPADFNSGVFAHSKVGQNCDPKSKVDEFTAFIEKGIGERADIVALKFCYVDITADSDVIKIFDDYVASVDKIKMKYPELTLIHYTLPLTSIQTGFKAWIKKSIGRPINGVEDNVKRNEYNEMLVKQYDGKEHIFDLAAIESTKPDGTRVSSVKDEKVYYYLNPAYTDDGGHLDKKGRKFVADQFVIYLSKLVDKK
jgi:hypothetical protein